MTAAIVCRSEHVVPNTSRHAEVYLWEGVMNFVMDSEFAIPPFGEIKVVMHVMKHAVQKETGC